MNNVNSRPSGKRRKKKIDKDVIEKAKTRLDQFKSAKQGLNATIKFNEKWYRQRHMEYIRANERLSASDMEGDTVPLYKKGEQVEPVSAWLFNSIQNFHADYMDNFPRANVLAREPGDEEEAYKITKILPSLLDRIRFEAVYSRSGWTKAIQGWTVYSVTWDKDADNGRGEISIGRANLLNLYWDMEVDELEASSDVFYLHERDRDELIRDYPELEKELVATEGDHERHETVTVGSQPSKVTVVDWYYKKRTPSGRRVLHFCQFVGETLLYASENDASLSERGLYDHGKYPFVVDVLYPMEDALFGFGKIAVGASKQAYVDILSKSIMQNALWASVPRYFAKNGHGFNVADFLDLTKMVVEVEGDPNEYLMPVHVNGIDGNAINLKNDLVEELRNVTNANDAATGATPGGVTAASGIAALQEAGGKTSRDANRGSFRAFRELVTLVIELIRQFYTEAHFFRVMNEESGENVYIGIDNSALNREGGALFDLEITTEKNSSYTRMAQNELMLSFFNAGVFSPQNAAQSLALLQVMDFEGKEELIRMVGANDRRQQLITAVMEQMIVMAQAYDQLAASLGIPSNETANVAAMAQQVMGAGSAGNGMTGAAVPNVGSEPSYTKNAREEAASVASPG